MDLIEAFSKLRQGNEITREAWVGKQKLAVERLSGFGQDSSPRIVLLGFMELSNAPSHWYEFNLLLDEVDIRARDWVVCPASASR